MTGIPAPLIQALGPVGTQRFTLLPARRKYPPPIGWAEPENEYTPDSPELVAHLRAGGNYAVVFGRGVVGLDTDFPETEIIAKTFPLTFTVKSGGEGDRFHRYYRSNLEKTTPLRKSPAPGEKKRGYGEIRASRAYLVGPGSVHPETGRKYVIFDPRPMAFISEEQLGEAFKDYIEPDPEPQEPTRTRTLSPEIGALKIEDVINTYGINLKKVGGELRGVNPTHGDNPSSFAVNLGKNTWRCHACQSGGGPIELVAIMEKIISCDQAKRGALRGGLFKEVLTKAREKGLTKEANTAPTLPPEIPQLMPGYRVAQITNGWVLLEAGGKEKPLLTFSFMNDLAARKISKRVKIDIEQVESQFAALTLYLEETKFAPEKRKEAEAARKEAATAKEMKMKIAAGGYDRYLDLSESGRVIKCYYDVLVEDILEKYILITFTDIEDVWVYDANARIYRDTGISTIKKFVHKALGEFFLKTFCEEVIYQTKIATYITRGDMEPPAELLNLRNGVLNVRTRELMPHTPKLFFINCSPTDYDPEAKAPYFDAMIESFKCRKIKAVQEFTGYLLLDSVKYKKALFLNGPTDSGKTTFTNAIINVIGKEATCSIAIQNLDHRFQEQRLYKKRVNFNSDLGSEAFNSVNMFLRTVGGDLLEAEVKGANKTLKFPWGGKHWFGANKLPPAEGDADADAFYNRLLMATLSIQISKEEQDRNLPDKLKLETSGVLKWMLEGLDRLEKNGDFSDTTSIEEIKDFYKRASDSTYCFVRDRCLVKEKEFIVKIESHQRYVTYCIKHEYTPVGRSQFYEKLTNHLQAVKTDRRKVGTETPQVWMNLYVLKDDDPDNKDEPPEPPTYGPTKDPEPTNLTKNTTLPALPPPAPLQPSPTHDLPLEGFPAVAGDAGNMVTLVTLVGLPPKSKNVQVAQAQGIDPVVVEKAPEPVEGDPPEAERVPEPVQVDPPPPPGDPRVRLRRLAEGFMQRQPNGSSPRQLFFNYMLEAGYGEEEVISTLANVKGWVFGLIFVQFHPRGVAP